MAVSAPDRGGQAGATWQLASGVVAGSMGPSVGGDLRGAAARGSRAWPLPVASGIPDSKAGEAAAPTVRTDSLGEDTQLIHHVGGGASVSQRGEQGRGRHRVAVGLTRSQYHVSSVRPRGGRAVA